MARGRVSQRAIAGRVRLGARGLPRGAWTHRHLVGHLVSLPAIAPEETSYGLSDHPEDVRRAGELLHEVREPRQALEEIRRSQGSLTFSAQYQQAPVPPEGNILVGS